MADNKKLISLEERIAERVGKELVDLIPEEQWRDLIKTQIDVFMRNKAPGIVQEMLRVKFMESVKVILDSADYADEWDSVSQANVVGPAIQDLFKQAAPDILLGMINPVIQQLVYDFRNRVSQF